MDLAHCEISSLYLVGAEGRICTRLGKEIIGSEVRQAFRPPPLPEWQEGKERETGDYHDDQSGSEASYSNGIEKDPSGVWKPEGSIEGIYLWRSTYSGFGRNGSSLFNRSGTSRVTVFQTSSQSTTS